MPDLLKSPYVQLGLVAAALYAAYRFGPDPVKIAALGVAGMVVVNQVPVLRDGVDQRLVA